MFLFFSASNAFAEGKQVEGVGVAEGSNETAHNEAVQKALRNALEKSIGVMVSSESLVKNFQLIQDSIYSNVQGYVKDYQVTEDNKGADGVTKIKVLASVEESRLENDLKGIKVVLDAKGNPKTMVVIGEKMDGEPAPLISDAITQFFADKTFPMIDHNQLEMIKGRDADEAEKDPVKAKVLGNRYGAELILTGSAQSKLASSKEAYGAPVFSYSANLSLKAISSDTGEILAIMNESGTAFAGSQKEASIKALSQAWENGRDGFFKTIMEKFRSSVVNSQEVTIIVSKCTPDLRPDIKKKLAGAEGIKNLNEKSFKDEVCEFTADVDGAMVKDLDEKISETIPELVLTGKTANRLDFQIKNEK